MLAINEVLQQGRYRITHRFGLDGIGAGYEAFDNVLETNVLLKEILVSSKKVSGVILPETADFGLDEDAKTFTEVKHPALLGVSDYFSEVDRRYLVLESVDGTNLSELLEKNKKSFTLSNTAKWADQLLDALHYLHLRNPPIVHRDIKPQNIKLTSDDKIKLLVFGAADETNSKSNPATANQMFDPAALPYSPLELIWGRLDRASQNVITNSYDEKSEKILNLPADARSDIYSLGATLYHLLTARIPIDALERSIDILEGKPDPLPAPHELNSKIPSEISRVLMKALEIKRENRFDSALIMRQVLRTAVVRVREREADEAKKQEDILEIPFSEAKKTESITQTAEPERLKGEVEQRRETELIKKQLQESEASRIKAEQRAEEAERRLSEKQTKDFGDKKSTTTAATVSEKQPAPIFLPTNGQPEPTGESIQLGKSSDEFKDLSVQPEKNYKIRRRMALVVLVLVILGGGFAGFQFLQTSNTAELNQIFTGEMDSSAIEPVAEATVQTPLPPIAETEPENVSETIPETVAELTPETSRPTTESESSSPIEPENVPEPIDRQPGLKNKAAVSRAFSPQRVEKRPAPVKSPAKQRKKIITVDDIINDN